MTLTFSADSLTTQRSLSTSQQQVSKALERLSTGLRVNNAADDTVGQAMGTRLKAQIRSLEQAQRNTNDAISLVQVAEGGLDQIAEKIIQMRALMVQLSNETLAGSDRDLLVDEYTSLVDGLEQVAQATDFNGINLLNGDSEGGLTFQVGGNNDTHDQITVSMANVSQDAYFSYWLGFNFSIPLDFFDVSNVAVSDFMISIFDSGIELINEERANLGAAQSRLSFQLDGLDSQIANLSSARSRIVDADIARETLELTRSQILVQAGLSVVAQSNTNAQSVLGLL